MENKTMRTEILIPKDIEFNLKDLVYYVSEEVHDIIIEYLLEEDFDKTIVYQVENEEEIFKEVIKNIYEEFC